MTAERRTLFRNTQRGKLGGVCAGIADYFGWEVWLVRVVVVSLFLFGGYGWVLVLYLALWLVLDSHQETRESEHEVKGKVWQAGRPPREAFRDVVTRFELLDKRLQKLEERVTSKAFQLRREFETLEKS